jgi:GDSL-like Lipase/Acylhydrolase family
MTTHWVRLLVSALAVGFGPAGGVELARAQPPAAAETLSFQSNDVVALLGGENVVAMQENGYLELLLTLAGSGPGIRIRDLGWEGDTVFEERRDLNFGSWEDQLSRAGATVLFCQFGQMESLRGKAGLESFKKAYQELLDRFLIRTRRLVLFSPIPFERKPAPLPDLSLRNADARLYAKAIQALARARGLRYVDLLGPLELEAGRHPNRPWTRDGLHLNPWGHWLAARATAAQLGWSGPLARVTFQIESDTLTPPTLEQARRIIVEKNGLWFDYWRPMNWAFLKGDRIDQPSSHDYRDPKVRWFPKEMEEFLPLIADKEERIASALKGL